MEVILDEDILFKLFQPLVYKILIKSMQQKAYYSIMMTSTYLKMLLEARKEIFFSLSLPWNYSNKVVRKLHL